MRFTGTLITWNDERGYGFIEPTLGGQEIFVHIKSFPTGSRRPSVGQELTFEVEVEQSGKKRAKLVQYPARARAARPAREVIPASWTTWRALAIPFLGLVYGLVVLYWGFKPIVPVVYLVLSLIAFLAYAFDKSAAITGRWRTAESTLHLVALAGGWPGALVAQQTFRHKTTKPSFVATFWVTVGVNLLGLVLWHAVGKSGFA